MAFFTPPPWTAGMYSSGTQVSYNGVLYEASVDTTSRPDLSNDWNVIAVHTIQDYNSLVEAVRLNLNVDDNEINRSVPLFIQLAEESFKTRIRVPQQRRRVLLTTDDESRIEAPGDLLEVINLRQNSDAPAGTFVDIRSRGVIEILNGNYEEYQRLLRFESANGYAGYHDLNAFDSPLYWFDSQYFNIAPRYERGTEIELWYYSTIPQLGTVVNITDAEGRPLNSAGQTEADWVAGGGTAQTFVQATQVVTQNWFTAAAPQMLLYGALCKSEAYLKDPERVTMWKEAFAEAQAETQDMINRFENSQPHTLFIENTYSSQI